MWPTEPWTTMSTPFIEIPQRAAALPRITSEPAAAGRARRLRRVAVHDHRAGHDVLGAAHAHVAVHADGGLLVHAGAVVARVALDLDLDRSVDPHGERVRAARVQARASGRGEPSRRSRAARRSARAAA